MIKKFAVFESNSIDHVKDCFVNLSDEYKLIITKKENNIYNIYINLEFNINIINRFSNLTIFENNIEQIQKFKNLLKESIYRFDNIKYEIMFGSSKDFEWDFVDDIINEEFCEDPNEFVWIRINIRESVLQDGQLSKLEDNNLIINLDELKKIISNHKFESDGIIIDGNEIQISVTEDPNFLDETSNKIKLKKKSSILKKFLNSKFGNVISDSWCFNYVNDEGGQFVFVIKEKYEIILE